MNTEKTAWDFVEQYYPNYSNSEEIAENNDLQVLINGEEEEGSKAWEIKEDIKSSVSFGRLYDPQKLKDRLCTEEIKRRYNESCKTIYEKAIEGYFKEKEFKNKNKVSFAFTIADVDQAMEENDIDYPLTDHGKLEALRHAKNNFDANASYWDNIVEGIYFVINKSNGVKS